MQDLIASCSLLPVTFQQWHAWWQKRQVVHIYTNAPWLSWGMTKDGVKRKYKAAEEVEYPPLLCSRISTTAHAEALRLGLQDLSTLQ